MDLFCFASKNEENIRLGIHHQMWAVAAQVHDATMTGRITKADRYFFPGCVGLLYCKPLQAFTTPFVVESRADPVRVVHDIWPEPWRLPFKIKTLGSLSRTLPIASAAKRWPTLERRLKERAGRGGVPGSFNVTGTTVFVPVSITPEDWLLIQQDLAT